MKAPPVTAIDVGSPRLSGATRPTGSGVDLVAGGADIWGTRDEFHFAHIRIAGDFTLSACVESLEMADPYTKAGLMLRASLEAGAEHAYLLAFGDNQARNNNNGGLEFQYRAQADGPCTGIYPPQPLPAQPDFPVEFPQVWLRLSWKGTAISAENSRNGRDWRVFCVHRQSLPAEAYLGLAVTSHNVNRTVRAVFTNLQLSQP